MSDFNKLNTLASPPAAALAGTVREFSNADGELRLIDEFGTVYSIRQPYPKALSTVRLPTFSGALAAGATHTYTMPLGGSYSEVLLANFQWVTADTTDPSQPGTSLGHGIFGQDQGPMLVANTKAGGWRRIFKLDSVEHANNVGTDLEAQIFDGFADTPVPLGYGVNSKDVAVDHINAFGKEVQLEDIYILGTDLIVKLKNAEPVDSIDFDIYTGVERVFGYRAETYFGTVATGGFMAISGDHVADSLWISADYGLTWEDHADPAQTDILAGSATYKNGSDYFMAFLDYNFNVWTGSSTTDYTWAQVNTFALTWGGGDYQLNGGSSTSQQAYGGNCIDWNDSIGAFFAFHNYTMDANLFLSVDGFANIGANNPTYDDVLPIFEGSAELPDMSPYNPGGAIDQAQNQNPYVKTVGTDDLFVSFCYLAGGISQITEITCSADTIGSLNSTYFYLGAEQDAGALYYFWFNVSGTGTDPMDTGIAVEVDIVINDTDAAVAAALDAAMTGTGNFSCSTVGGVVTATNVLPGFVSGYRDLNTGFGFSTTQAPVSFRKQALFHSANKGSTWAEILAASPDWKEASNRFVNVSDDGGTIYIAVIGETGHTTYPYLDGEFHFNYSTDGGATWTYTDGSWPLISDDATTAYSSQSHGSPYVSEGLIAHIAAGALICIFRGGANTTPMITRSLDNGVTWTTAVALAAWSATSPQPENTRGRQSDSVDEFFAFISYGYASNNSTSFAYKGINITTLTSWGAFGVV